MAKTPDKHKKLLKITWCNNLQCNLKDRKGGCGALISTVPSDFKVKYDRKISKKFFEPKWIGDESKFGKIFACGRYVPFGSYDHLF